MPGPLMIVRHGGPPKRRALSAAARETELVVVDTRAEPALGFDVTLVAECDVESVVGVAARRGDIAGAATFVDPASPLTAAVARRLGLPGLDPEQAERLKDKRHLRRLLTAAGARRPAWTEVVDVATVDMSQLRFPCVLKPARGAYGLGIERVGSADELPLMWRRARQRVTDSLFGRMLVDPARTPWLLEEQLGGLELSIEVLAIGAAVHVLAVHEKVIEQRGSSFREVRFVTAPWRLSQVELDRIETQAAELVRVLGFDHGVGDLEARWDGAELSVLELQLCPSGGLVADMVLASHGVDLHALHARAALLGRALAAPQARRTSACAMEFLHASRAGGFAIHGLEAARRANGVIAIDVPHQRGKVVDSDAEYLGFIVASGADSDEAVRRVEAARRLLTIEACEGNAWRTD
jgi:formate-dependent phosphoribosylglycinamide formyltransferase (GAR transformylase)